MCGIAGIIDLTPRPIEPALLVAMNRAIAHRGPDDEGYVLMSQTNLFVGNYSGLGSADAIRANLPPLGSETTAGAANVGLAHRRFSIIDLSVDAHQPFFDQDRQCCIVFNGEIYNYIEVRDELASLGIRCRTQSDTEVLLEAYKHWGTDCFSRLNGFWAIALYDFRTKQLLLSRDRLGKKPLYWSKAGSRVYFASEIKALLRVPEIHRARKVNEEAAFHWLVSRRKDMHFSTCFDGINSLPSACWAYVDEHFPNECKTFWKVPEERASEKDISTADAAKAVRDLLQDAVTIRLRADVPLDIELSGGMDSSALVALAASSQARRFSTYTVRFPDKESNEEPFARSVANRYNVDYQVIESPTSNFFSQLLAFTYLEEEPYHSPNLQVNQVIWTQMRARGCKVSLNGAGGDENFAGYSSYTYAAQTESIMQGKFVHYVQNAFRYSEGRTGLRNLVTPLVRLARATLFSGTEDRPVPSHLKIGSFAQIREPLTLSEALHGDMTNTLMPYWLRSGDRGYMGIPLEVRAPFLDYRIVDLAFQLPTSYLFRDGWHKWILRKAVEDLLPADVVWRRRKLGFPFPYRPFYSDYADVVEMILSQSQNPYIDFSRADEFRRDWPTLSFILWYELFFNENIDLFRRIEEKAQRLQPPVVYGYSPEFLKSFPIADIVPV